jgi:membrane protease YdiL (CAAX protease family)
MAAEWLLVGVVAWGVRLGGSSISSLIGEKWARLSHFLRDLGLSLAFLLIMTGVLSILAHVLQPAPNQNIRNLLPHTLAEKCVWVLVALTAGICEELMTRGYLQKQLYALLKRGPAAILAQGIIFGAAHAYQGWKYMVIIAVLGTMLGWLAHWRRSLLPGMIFHFIQDTLGGLASGVR